MQYKGDDMDLRVPSSRGPRESYPATDYDPAFANGRWRTTGGAAPAVGTEPLWVDEVVLACCNTAFDMALAHGAPEVEIEHLVHALTRVEAASRVLEARGVRDGQLRRESAALMASDVPTTMNADRLAPRRSGDVEDALRRAVDVAGRRGSAATIDDLLWVLLHFGREHAAVQLLRRMTPDWQRLDWGRTRDAVPPQQSEPALRYGGQPVISEPHRYVAPQPEPVRYVQTAAIDTLSHRLGALEDGLRTLHAELGLDRKALTDLIRDMQRDIVAHRGDAAALRSDLGQRLEMLERGLQVRGDSGRIQAQMAERLQQMEKSVLAGLAEVTRAPTQLNERLQQLEKAVHGGLGEGARNWAALGQRLQAFEGQLGQPRESRTDQQPIIDRLAMMETGIDARVTDIGRGVATLTDRLVSLERIAETSAGEGARRWTSLSDRLGNLETTLTARGRDPQLNLSELTDRLAGLERAVRAGFGESAQQTQTVADRVGDIEKLVGTDQGDAALMVDERLAAIERRIEAGVAGQGDLVNRITSGLAAIESRPGGDSGQQVTAFAQVATPLAERLAGLERNGQKQMAETQVALAELTNRIGAMEGSIGQSISSQADAAATRDREIADMHEALIRLGENQHTLASAISDWRLENHNRLAAVTTQIDRLAMPEIQVAQSAIDDRRMPQVISDHETTRIETRDPDQPRSAIDRGNQDADPRLANAQLAPTVSPEKRRGFWYWLFGTDSISRSNRESEIRWQRMRQRMQEARDRRRGNKT